MEYGQIINNQSVRHIGYTDTNDCIKSYFDPVTVKYISNKVTEYLSVVSERPVLVVDNTIIDVMNQVYESYRPKTGDIFSRYIIPQEESTSDTYVQNMIEQTINIIVSDVKNNFQTDINNTQLSVWNTVLGDFNPHMIQQHGAIKVRKRRPTPMMFNMNY